ncbi:MAG: hypothetical protein ACJ789_02725 [Thermomicrobiales bacterium]
MSHVSQQGALNRHPTLATDQRELRFTLHDSPVVETRSAPGTIDVGEGGRLLGLEVDLSGLSAHAIPGERDSGDSVVSFDGDGLYFAIMPDLGGQSRSAPVTVAVGLNADGSPVQLAIARRGAEYEITYPSGNR